MTDEMEDENMIRVAMIGFGGIASGAHYPAYTRLEAEGKAKVVAACDLMPSRFESKMKINIGGADDSIQFAFNRYTDWHEMLEKEEVDMVDICVPTYLHADIAVEVMNLGYDVLSEKPMAINYEACLRMLEAAKKTGRKLMIGQCLRFGANYKFLKEAVEKGTFGKITAGVFRRLSPPPVWGWTNWYMDHERSKGAILDLHIHDIDIIRYILGEPDMVSCDTIDMYSGDDIAYSRLYYPDATILAIGDWSREGTQFVADYEVTFEKATVSLGSDGLMVYPRDGEAYKADVDAKDFYEEEIRFFIQMLETGCENTENPPSSAATTVKLIETLKASADKRGEKIPFEA